MKILKNFMQ